MAVGRVGQIGCTCGYYGYFDNGHNPHHTKGNVLAVVEAYGVTTVGSRGFRAEKARIVGLIDPAHKGWRRVVNHRNLAWLCLAANTFKLAQSLVLTRWSDAASSVVAMAIIAALMFAPVFRDRIYPKSTPLPESVRANYPDVPVYRSRKAALKAHPLTPPPKPTPETDADFWTRAS